MISVPEEEIRFGRRGALQHRYLVFVSDFDLMEIKKKALTSLRREKKTKLDL